MDIDIHEISTKNLWCEKVQQIIDNSHFSEANKDLFHTIWTVKGHRIREQINNDSKLTKMLRVLLPNYKSGSKLLYRGENIQRWKDKKIGFCWTPSIDTARMFARVLNSSTHGGVLLKYCFHPERIIAGPSKHSLYLGEEEYTVDSSNIQSIEAIEYFKPTI